jgi:hypothetical protein
MGYRFMKKIKFDTQYLFLPILIGGIGISLYVGLGINHSFITTNENKYYAVPGTREDTLEKKMRVQALDIVHSKIVRKDVFKIRFISSVTVKKDSYLISISCNDGNNFGDIFGFSYMFYYDFDGNSTSWYEYGRHFSTTD